jgi:hypothetical protein
MINMTDVFATPITAHLTSIYPNLIGLDIIVNRMCEELNPYNTFNVQSIQFLQQMNREMILTNPNFIANTETVNQVFREIGNVRGYGSFTCFWVFHEISEKEFHAITEAKSFFKKSYLELVEMFRPSINVHFTYEDHVIFKIMDELPMLFESIKQVIEKFFIFIIGCNVPLYRLLPSTNLSIHLDRLSNPAQITIPTLGFESISNRLVSKIVVSPNPIEIIDAFSEDDASINHAGYLGWLSVMKHPLYHETTNSKELLKMKCLFICETLKPIYDDLMNGYSIEKYMKSDPDFCCLFGYYLTETDPFKTINEIWCMGGYFIGLHFILKREPKAVPSHSQFRINADSVIWDPKVSLMIEI